MLRNKLNIGSCEFSMARWLNLDKPSDHYGERQRPIDVKHDLMSLNPIALPDESLQVAYTSHTIEHISDVYVHHMFSEVYRMLQKKGAFRISCPDIGKCYDAYLERDEEYISNWLLNPAGHKRFRSLGVGERFLFIFASYLSPYRDNIKCSHPIKKYQEQEIEKIFTTMNKHDALTYFTSECQKYAPVLQPQYPGEHISWWSHDKLKDMLESVGFKNVAPQEFNQSANKHLKDFDGRNSDNVKTKDYTLFLECEK